MTSTKRSELEAAVREGILSADQADRLAAFLARQAPAPEDQPRGIQGLRLVGKANPDRAALEDIARVMLRCLEN